MGQEETTFYETDSDLEESGPSWWFWFLLLWDPSVSSSSSSSSSFDSPGSSPPFSSQVLPALAGPASTPLSSLSSSPLPASIPSLSSPCFSLSFVFSSSSLRAPCQRLMLMLIFFGGFTRTPPSQMSLSVSGHVFLSFFFSILGFFLSNGLGDSLLRGLGSSSVFVFRLLLFPSFRELLLTSSPLLFLLLSDLESASGASLSLLFFSLCRLSSSGLESERRPLLRPVSLSEVLRSRLFLSSSLSERLSGLGSGRADSAAPPAAASSRAGGRSLKASGPPLRLLSSLESAASGEDDSSSPPFFFSCFTAASFSKPSPIAFFSSSRPSRGSATLPPFASGTGRLLLDGVEPDERDDRLPSDERDGEERLSLDERDGVERLSLEEREGEERLSLDDRERGERRSGRAARTPRGGPRGAGASTPPSPPPPH
ncbi:hypothetical protein EYF80_050671 [Liparis tanakae]|uniref:Uncharacterized protein n=1 Tax=Liparis tanakae TaxID=230148 RepID=A0A4Z2FE58_9TELE|nr:hypothetical protein EYF80_050671 [Liparis tanakae]